MYKAALKQTSPVEFRVNQNIASTHAYESGTFRPQTISPPSRFAPKTFPP